jgi:hypothetical protein
MKIDFNKVLAAAMPDRIEIELDGKSYFVKDPTIIDVAGFESIQKPVDGEAEDARALRILGFLRSWFDGDAPPFLTDPLPTTRLETNRLIQQVMILAKTVSELIVDMADRRSLPKVMARAQGEARAQIEASRAETGSGSGL